VFDHWEGDRPIGRDEPDAWTQILAVNLEQTKNTMKLFPGLIPPRPAPLRHPDRQAERLVGRRPPADRGGHELGARDRGWPAEADHPRGDPELGRGQRRPRDGRAIEGNAAKAEIDAPARILDIFNAYRPAVTRWPSGRGGTRRLEADGTPPTVYGVLWDSLEAPPDAPLTAKDAPAVVESIAGDATGSTPARTAGS
jgi:hypothetical protein